MAGSVGVAVSLQYIPLWDIEREWPAVEPLLLKALAKQTGLSAESVKADCLRGKFWLWHVPGRVAFVTEIQQFPLERICMIVLCGGDGIEDWLSEADDTLTRHAKHFGCAALMVIGRKGWSLAAPEYKLEAHVMRKAIS